MNINSNAGMQSAVNLWVGRFKAAASEAAGKIVDTGSLVVEAEKDLATMHGDEAVRRFRKQSGITASHYSKLKSIGLRADILRQSIQNLPPSMSSIYLLSQIESEDRLKDVISRPLRECRRTEIARLAGKIDPAVSEWSDILTIRAHSVVDPKTRQRIVEEIAEAIKKITTSNKLSDKINAYCRPA